MRIASAAIALVVAGCAQPMTPEQRQIADECRYEANRATASNPNWSAQVANAISLQMDCMRLRAAAAPPAPAPINVPVASPAVIAAYDAARTAKLR